MEMEILVIGGGVSGLTAAIRLQEAVRGTPWRVRIWTCEPPVQTTSGVAAALWYPYKVTGGRVDTWGRLAFATFVDLAHDPASGVRLGRGIELLRSPQPADPHGARACAPFAMRIQPSCRLATPTALSSPCR